MKIKMSPFTLKVIANIKKIPRGKVATYGQIARLSGQPHSSRAVGWVLNSCTTGHKLPWQRVINSKGSISFHPHSQEYADQKRLLQKEGIKFTGPHTLDLDRYQWKKEPPPAKPKRGMPTMF
jgi:methylated-DNA-protein-cysteine methyltransferase related protein